MKIAIIGTGISGLTAAYLLSGRHDVHVFEKNNYIGGHTNTIEVELNKRIYNIDTGFIVYNEKTYPNFCRLIKALNVATQASDMSFSVSCGKTGLEYNGTRLNTLFAQRRNLLDPRFYRFIFNILAFNKKALRTRAQLSEHITLGDYISENNLPVYFVNYYLLPMAAAIWSTGTQDVRDFPMKHFVDFFANHGMLSVNDRPQWRIISGGSKNYVLALTKPYAEKIHLNAQVNQVRRNEKEVILTFSDGSEKRFDEVVIATHSDEALQLLADPSADENRILSCFPYQQNSAVLHYDERLLPKNKRALASWNYHVFTQAPAAPVATVTYYMNLLQNIKSEYTFCVSLNCDAYISPKKIIRRIDYSHPQYSVDAFKAQREHALISGVNRTHYCGAYWGYGFHEDGVNSALKVAQRFGAAL